MLWWAVKAIYTHIVNAENLKFIDVLFIIKRCLVYFSNELSRLWLIKEEENACWEIHPPTLILSLFQFSFLWSFTDALFSLCSKGCSLKITNERFNDNVLPPGPNLELNSEIWNLQFFIQSFWLLAGSLGFALTKKKTRHLTRNVTSPT